SQIGYQPGDSLASEQLTSIHKQTGQLEFVVLVFLTPDCPYVQMYQERLLKIESRFAERGVQFIAINPQSHTDSSEANMKALIASFPYLPDPGQAISRQFGVTRSPQCFLLQRSTEDQYIVRYVGAIDDNTREAANVNQSYLQDALEAILGSKAIQKPYTRATGCGIKWLP
ncbi:MAG: redoxin domain-containing protein, partial [Bacteroidota bacterium]